MPRRKHTITTRLESLTPRKAQQFYDNRAPNRPMNDHYVRRLAGAMQADRWEINGETIKINANGQMEDGQHRCAVVILSGVTIQTFITRGLPENVFDTIDTGNRRTVGHVLAKYGETSYNILAAAIGLLWRYETGKIASTNRSMRHDEALIMLKKHPGLRDGLDHYGKTRAPGLGLLLPPSVAVFTYYMFSQKDPVLAARFFEQLGTGEDLKQKHPIYQLRARLSENKTTKSKLGQPYLLAITIKAWNFYRQNKSIRYLRWRTD